MSRVWKNRSRDMHRRAQRAEGRLEAALFWAESIRVRALEQQDDYMASLADVMVRELSRGREKDKEE